MGNYSCRQWVFITVVSQLPLDGCSENEIRLKEGWKENQLGKKFLLSIKEGQEAKQKKRRR